MLIGALIGLLISLCIHAFFYTVAWLDVEKFNESALQVSIYGPAKVSVRWPPMIMTTAFCTTLGAIIGYFVA